MERLASTHPLHRAFSVMAADPQSPLDRDERAAVVSWLLGLETNILILLPSDLLPKLIPYLESKDPSLLALMTIDRIAEGYRFKKEADVLPLESPLEIDFYLTWRELALDLLYPLSPQYPIKDGQYRLDFAFPPLRVGIELDGYTYHSTEKHLLGIANGRGRSRRKDGASYASVGMNCARISHAVFRRHHISFRSSTTNRARYLLRRTNL